MKEKDETEMVEDKRPRYSVIRMASALLLAAMLLAVTGFTPIKMLRGPTETEAIQNNEIGDFVSRDINAILGFYADDINSGGETIGRYAVVPMDGQFVSAHFTKRYLESADSVYASTNDYISGNSYLDVYVVVEGTVQMLSEESSGLMYDWFGKNRGELIASKMIADTDDYSDYLTDYVLMVDRVGRFTESSLSVLACLAGLFVLYAIIELFLMARGFYLPREANVEENTNSEYSESEGKEDREAENTEMSEEDE